ncbi:hypothetical protein ACQP1G_14355 [Nocardia sp. CA-107356]|uniref:hypothetical protein n=1 Tax=Nocardia sp. CA-107356 TaxID=3239972 RepID=UPI003D92E866
MITNVIAQRGILATYCVNFTPSGELDIDGRKFDMPVLVHDALAVDRPLGAAHQSTLSPDGHPVDIQVEQRRRRCSRPIDEQGSALNSGPCGAKLQVIT